MGKRDTLTKGNKKRGTQKKRKLTGWTGRVPASFYSGSSIVPAQDLSHGLSFAEPQFLHLSDGDKTHPSLRLTHDDPWPGFGTMSSMCEGTVNASYFIIFKEKGTYFHPVHPVV